MEIKDNLMRKLGFDDIIEFTLKLYKKHFFYFIKLFGYFFIPAMIIIIIASAYSLMNYEKIITSLQNTQDSSPSEAIASTLFLSYFGKTMIWFLIHSLLLIIANAALVKGIHEKLINSNMPIRKVAVYTLKKAFPIIITTVITGIMYFFGFSCCCIPFVVVLVYTVFITQIMMIENKFYFKCIGRSFGLVQDYFWSILLIIIVYFFLYYFIMAVVQLAIYGYPYIKLIRSIIGNKGQIDPSFMEFFKKSFFLIIISSVVQNILLFLLLPILSIAISIKFLNIKNLKEGTALLDEIKKQAKNS